MNQPNKSLRSLGEGLNRMARVIGIFFTLFFATSLAWGLPGDLDPSFGKGGRVITSIYDFFDEARAVVRQPDGKVLVAGYRYHGSNRDFALVRYLSDGTLDNEFGSQGRVITDINNRDDVALYLVLQPDGKILVAGNSQSGIALVRYLANGVLDTTFGFDANGIYILDTSCDYSCGINIRGLALQSDGKILVLKTFWRSGFAGYSYESTVMRILADGKGLDTNFGMSGQSEIFYNSSNDLAMAMALQSDDRILVGGSVTNGSNSFGLSLIRLQPGGGLDISFGVNGSVTLGSEGAIGVVGLALQSDGKILVGDSVDWSSTTRVVRLQLNGAIDANFGSNGQIALTNFYFDQGQALGWQPDGKVVVAGHTFVNGSNNNYFDIVVLRLDPKGVPDSSFGTNGKVIADLGGSHDLANALALQPDGKILLAGSNWDGLSNETGSDFSLVRITPSGGLDGGFGGSGVVTTNLDSNSDSSDTVRAMAVQSDGKILLAGQVTATSSGPALARFHTNGDIDNTFGVKGRVWMEALDNSVESLAIQTDGKILVGGSTLLMPTRFSLNRYLENGEIDTGFGTMGRITTGFGTGFNLAQALDVVIQKDNKILLAGYAAKGPAFNADFAVARFLPGNGDLDVTFNSIGTQTTDLGTYSDIGRSIALQSDNNILVAGEAYPSWGLVRFTPSGILDTSFGQNGNGMVKSDLIPSQVVKLQQDGETQKILVAGEFYESSTCKISLARYQPSGVLDTGFGTAGRASADLGGVCAASEKAITFQPDGKILVAGSFFYDGEPLRWEDFALVRFKQNGTLDTSFGNAGKAITNLAIKASDNVTDIALLADGKILVGGSSCIRGGLISDCKDDFAIARYIGDWWFQDDVDAIFGVSGRVITPFGEYESDDTAQALALDATGRILVVGGAGMGGQRNFVLARYLANGELDSGFASNGTQTTDFGGGDDRAYALSRQPDGKILVVGASGNGTKDNFTLARFLESGTLDPGFGTGGQVTTALGASNDRAYAVTTQSDGKLLVGGASGAVADFALARYLANGNLDTGFGTGGKVITPVGTGSDYVQALAIQADDKILAAGGQWNGAHWDFALTRYLANGTLDTSFGNGGKVITSMSADEDAATALAVQADGKILVAGWSWKGVKGEWVLARYLASGALDTSFGDKGKSILSPGSREGLELLRQFAMTRYPDNTVMGSEGLIPLPVPQAEDVGTSLLLQPDGKILMAGWHFNGQDRDLALMRFSGLQNPNAKDPIQDFLNLGQAAYDVGARFLREKEIYKYGLVDPNGLAGLIGNAGDLYKVATYDEAQLRAAEDYYRWVLRYMMPTEPQAAQALAGLIQARLARIKQANFVWDFRRKEAFLTRYTDSDGSDDTGRVISNEITALLGMTTDQRMAISTLLDLWADPLAKGPGELLRGDYITLDPTLNNLKQESWQLLFSSSARLVEGALDLARKRLLLRFFSQGGADDAESRAEVVDEVQDLEAYVAELLQWVGPLMDEKQRYTGEFPRLTSRLGELRQLAIMTKQGYNPFGFVSEFVPFLQAGSAQDNLFTFNQLKGIANAAVDKAQEKEDDVDEYLKKQKGFAQTQDDYALRMAETQASYTQRLITLIGSFTHQGKTFPDYLTFLAPDRDLDGDNVSEREKLRGDLVAIFASKGGIQFGSTGQIHLQYKTIETAENRAQQAINDIGNLVKQMEYREEEAHEIAGVIQSEAENIFEITTGTGQKVGLLIRQKARLEANAIIAQKRREQARSMFSSFLNLGVAAVLTIATGGAAAPAVAAAFATSFAQDAAKSHISTMISMGAGLIADHLSGEDPAQTALARGNLDAQIAEVQAMERAEITLIQAAANVAQQLIRTKFQMKELALQQANLELSYLIATRDIAKEWTALSNMQGEAATLIADLKRMEELMEQLKDDNSWLAAEDVRDVITNVVLIADQALVRAQAWTFVALRALEYYANRPPQLETRQPDAILMGYYQRLYFSRKADDLVRLLSDMDNAATSKFVFSEKTTSCPGKGTLSMKYDLLADTYATYDTSGEPVTVDNGGENQFFFRDPLSGDLYTGELAYQALFRQALRDGLTTKANGKRILRLIFATRLTPNNSQASYTGATPYYLKSATTAKIAGFTHSNCGGTGVPTDAQGIQVNLTGAKELARPYVRLEQMGNTYLKHSPWTDEDIRDGRLLEKLTVWSQYEQLLPTWLISDLGVVTEEQIIGNKVSDLFQTLINGQGPGGKSLAFTDRSVANDRWELVIEEDEAAANAVFIKELAKMLDAPISFTRSSDGKITIKDYLADIQLWVGWLFRPG